MPFGDGTGPQGLGPRTGRGAGYCPGSGMPGSVNRLPGGSGFGFSRGRGMGCRWLGRGRGLRNGYWADGFPQWAREGYGYRHEQVASRQEEKEILKSQAEFLSKQLEDVKTRISTLEKAESKES